MSAPKPLPIVILASGAGTNARALIEHARQNPGRFAVKALISDRAGVPALAIAEKLGVPTHVIGHKDEAALLRLLKELKPAWALLAGYKRIVSEAFLKFFADENLGARVINVHPSLLPAYPGLGGYERAFRDGVKVAGVTVHFVNNELDAGLPILQEAFAREEADTLESFSARAQKIEHRLFCRVLDLAASGALRIQETDGSRWVSLGSER